MAPKKREKDIEVLKQPKIDHLQTDHELFMQAFEKPTQIYRYLRTRNMISPIFLNRNLSYMRHRMSRSHKSRNTFKIDTMLAQKMNKMRNDKASGISLTGEYLTLLFLGFFDKTQDDDIANGIKSKIEPSEICSKTVQVETVLLKISHNKRKDISSALMQVAIGKSDVTVNPTEMPSDGKVPTISIATESFSSVGVNQVTGPQLSFLLLFRVHMHTSGGNGYCAIANSIDAYDNGGSDEEPAAKRQKISGTTKLFGTELIIFDKYGRCLLKEGDYELTVQEILPQQQQLQKYNSPKKNSTWETIQPISGDRMSVDILDIYKQNNGVDDQNPVLVFSKSPSLKFRLQWTKEALPGLVDRPQPITINLNNNEGNDKENHKPEKLTSSSFKKNLNININNNSILTPAVVNGHTNSGCLVDGNTTAIVSIGALNTTASSCTSTTELKRYADEPKIDHIIYQFVYNNNSRQQTETKSDFHCPWCSLDCSSLYPLLKHLKLCHARFMFTYIPIPNGARIDVSINELYDGSYNGSPHDLLDTVSAFSRRGPVRRTVVTNLLVCRPRRQKHSLVEFIECDENEFDSQRPFITGHNRMYHHTMTCLPVHPKELDIDSEGESDPLWLQYKTMQMIDEFTDVNEGEKELMKMWNLHVMKYGYVGDCQIPVALEMFIEFRGRELLRKNLYRNFVLHMSSMFDFGLVSPEAMQKTIRKLQKMLFENPDLQRQVTTTRKEQMEYWTTVTVHKQVQPKTEKNADKASAGASGTSSTTLHKSSASGSGVEKKVKPTITAAKNTGLHTSTASSIGDKTEDHQSPIAWRFLAETVAERRLLPPEGNHFP
ncbi:polycomb protein suz12-B isoform X2 [Malaya genurostris]|uniref:polycomb protein suz12-B isoform X2 n=1 Tax=Malaya genurostris TaxID=325434 RepID=UPI0026F3AA33|nr:polycomb protein suz12-B isoform X2 [Malaya genurostris]